jgi:hypothetical protein
LVPWILIPPNLAEKSENVARGHVEFRFKRLADCSTRWGPECSISADHTPDAQRSLRKSQRELPVATQPHLAAWTLAAQQSHAEDVYPPSHQRPPRVAQAYGVW